MDTIIDVGTELLVDRSRLRDPLLRLIVAALGSKICDGSAWVAIDKQDLARCFSTSRATPDLITRQLNRDLAVESLPGMGSPFSLHFRAHLGDEGNEA